LPQSLQSKIFISFTRISAKTGSIYPDLEASNEFWNQILVQIATYH